MEADRKKGAIDRCPSILRKGEERWQCNEGALPSSARAASGLECMHGVKFEHDLKCERGAVHVIGGILVLLSLISTCALFGDRYRFSLLEEQLAEQAARIDELEAQLRMLTLPR